MDNDKLNFWLVLWLVFVAEIPCLIRTMAMQVRNESIWSVVWGTTAGNALALIVGIILAKFATAHVSPRYLEYIETTSALAMIGLGLYLLLRHNHAH